MGRGAVKTFLRRSETPSKTFLRRSDAPLIRPLEFSSGKRGSIILKSFKRSALALLFITEIVTGMRDRFKKSTVASVKDFNKRGFDDLNAVFRGDESPDEDCCPGWCGPSKRRHKRNRVPHYTPLLEEVRRE